MALYTIIPAIILSYAKDHIQKQWIADKLPFIGNMWGTNDQLSDDEKWAVE